MKTLQSLKGKVVMITVITGNVVVTVDGKQFEALGEVDKTTKIVIRDYATENAAIRISKASKTFMEAYEDKLNILPPDTEQ